MATEPGHTPENGLLTAFPWARHLPEDALPGFEVGLVDATWTCADQGHLGPLLTEITAWKRKAGVHVGPELRAAPVDLSVVEEKR